LNLTDQLDGISMRLPTTAHAEGRATCGIGSCDSRQNRQACGDTCGRIDGVGLVFGETGDVVEFARMLKVHFRTFERPHSVARRGSGMT
jgi:hypothetical protein